MSAHIVGRGVGKLLGNGEETLLGTKDGIADDWTVGGVLGGRVWICVGSFVGALVGLGFGEVVGNVVGEFQRANEGVDVGSVG